MRTDAVRGGGDNPTGRAVGAADSRFLACGVRFYEGGLHRHSFACLGYALPGHSARLVVLQTEKCYNVTCYMLQ